LCFCGIKQKRTDEENLPARSDNFNSCLIAICPKKEITTEEYYRKNAEGNKRLQSE
jgi:hypothetical protein